MTGIVPLLAPTMAANQHYCGPLRSAACLGQLSERHPPPGFIVHRLCL
jgi:hypothetical protein